jgi:hypothetical protein
MVLSNEELEIIKRSLINQIYATDQESKRSTNDVEREKLNSENRNASKLLMRVYNEFNNKSKAA